MIDGIKRTYRIIVGDSIVRKPDSRLSKWDDVVVCLPGRELFFLQRVLSGHYLVRWVWVKG